MTPKKPTHLHKKSGKPMSLNDTVILNKIAALIALKDGMTVHAAIKKILGWKKGDLSIDGDSEVRRIRAMWDRSINSCPGNVQPPERFMDSW